MNASSEVAAVDIPLYEQPEIHDRRWFLLGIMCLSLVMVVMAVSGLNVAIPSIQRSLGATATDLQWIIDSYAIIFAGLLLSAGAIGDRFGRKRALAGWPRAVRCRLGARHRRRLGRAWSSPPARSWASAQRSSCRRPSRSSRRSSLPHERGKAIAVWAGFAGAGGALGPLVVGFLLTDWWVFPAYWWGAAFLVNVFTVVVVLHRRHASGRHDPRTTRPPRSTRSAQRCRSSGSPRSSSRSSRAR